MKPPVARVRVATRESRLAMVQTEMVSAALRSRYPELEVAIVGMTTKGDQVLDRPLAQVGGKGLFVKELESAMLEDRADIAVHSMKDVPMELPEDFTLVTFGERELAEDAFVSNRYPGMPALPAGAIVGTSSLRRECQLRARYPHLQFRALRGNVNTRLAKLDKGEYDAIILAVAGLKRLGFEARIRDTLTDTIPAIAQGILAIEFRSERDDIARMLAPFEHPPTACAAAAERALGLVVEGSCEVPVGAHARIRGDTFDLEAFIGMPDGTQIVRERASGRCEDAPSVGRALGERLLASGGREILKRLARVTS